MLNGGLVTGWKGRELGTEVVLCGLGMAGRRSLLRPYIVTRELNKCPRDDDKYFAKTIRRMSEGEGSPVFSRAHLRVFFLGSVVCWNSLWTIKQPYIIFFRV